MSSPHPSQRLALTPVSSNSSLRSSTSSKASSATSTGSSPLSGGNTHPEKNEKAPNGRPLSHHRRKSSVSTRRESQEIITGVAVAEDEEVTGSRDEIRKRALLALEGGRSVVSGFARVEIPEWKTPGVENKTFDWDPCESPFSYSSSFASDCGIMFLCCSGSLFLHPVNQLGYSWPDT